MSRKTYEYAQCNGCFKEERIRAAQAFGVDRLPEGWVYVGTADGGHLWDLCGACHKEIAVMLFDSNRMDRVLEQNNEPKIESIKIFGGPCVTRKDD
jgi:hypothetical protein